MGQISLKAIPKQESLVLVRFAKNFTHEQQKELVESKGAEFVESKSVKDGLVVQ